MMKWWHDREPNEQRLLGFAGALLFLLVVWQFAVLPIGRANTAAKEAELQARDDLKIVQTSLPALAQGPARSGQPFSRAVLVQRAMEADIALQRVQPGQDSELEFWVEGAATPALMDLLHRLTTENGAQILQVHMSRNETRGVDARIRIEAS